MLVKFTQDEIKAMLNLVDKSKQCTILTSLNKAMNTAKRYMQLVKAKARGAEFKVTKEIAHPTSKDDVKAAGGKCCMLRPS